VAGTLVDVPTRIPQQERSRATQRRLLEATVDCLVEHGWSGTTTTLIASTAGV
jgi:AcrR family transcriptional regulator